MHILLLGNLGSTIVLIFGVILVVFRKQIARLNIKTEYKHAKPKQMANFKQAKKLGLLPYLSKFQEICAIVVGLIFMVWGLQELFFPQADKYVAFIFGFFGLSIFAAVGAGALTFILILPLLKVDKYMREKYPELWEKSKSRSIRNKWEIIRLAREVDDPTLRRLPIKALICGTILFVILFIVLLFVFYVIIKATATS